MDNEKITYICNILKKTPHAMDNEISEFKIKFPKLYEYVRTEQYDEELLNDLLIYRTNTEQNFVDINMTVSEKIAEKYLYNDDTLKRPSEAQMNIYKEKIRKASENGKKY